MIMEKQPQLKLIEAKDRQPFLEMAIRHFNELNPAFSPQEDWKLHYFSSLLSSEGISPCWIVIEREHVGFLIYGTEPHRFLPRLTGMIYELYIDPNFRRRGLAEAAASKAIAELKLLDVSKIQLEVMVGNKKAEMLWSKLGFREISKRLVLQDQGLVQAP